MLLNNVYEKKKFNEFFPANALYVFVFVFRVSDFSFLVSFAAVCEVGRLRNIKVPFSQTL